MWKNDKNLAIKQKIKAIKSFSYQLESLRTFNFVSLEMQKDISFKHLSTKTANRRRIQKMHKSFLKKEISKAMSRA